MFVRPLFPHKKAGGKELSLKQGENNEERKQRRKDGWNKKARKEEGKPVSKKVWKREIMDGQKNGGGERGMKGRNERRKDDRTEEIEWKNKGMNNRE